MFSRSAPNIVCAKRPILGLAVAGLAILAALVAPTRASAQAASRAILPPWPGVTRQMRPWIRWWWMGSAVDSANLAASLRAYRAAGLGGVELTPIYGVHGYETRFIRYLSPDWVRMFTYTVREAQRQHLGVDLANATGWPFGGPWVTPADASKDVWFRTWTLQGGERLRDTVDFREPPLVRMQRGGTPPVAIGQLRDPVSRNRGLHALAMDQVRFPRLLPLVALMAYADAGTMVDLTGRVGPGGVMDWIAPPGRWTLYAVFQGWHGKQVERGAPGGEGDVIDHFSATAVRHYLAHFDSAFAGTPVARGGVRAFFNDSYEVDDARGQADWTPRLFREFRRRRGYDLRHHLPALFAADSTDEVLRVRSDYRETISELLRDDFTATWRAWAHARGALVRDQAHGSPGNILDLYAASDIPETEGVDLLRMKFASSAAHVTGKPLASSESATWLNEHFLSTLGDVRAALDRYFLGGVNHVVYHGTAYSPEDAPWPGWLFYAAVHFQPANPWWRDFGALNAYVARVQAFVQRGAPDNDVLLYFPIFDRFADASGPLLEHFSGVGAESNGAAFQETAERLQQRGYAVDFVSDRQIETLGVRDGMLRAANQRYAVVVVPDTHFMPLGTLEWLLRLAREGATIVIQHELPRDVPGLGRLAERRARFEALLATLHFAPDSVAGIRRAGVGRGAVLVGDDLDALLARTRARREPMTDHGLSYVRRTAPVGGYGGSTYFIVNTGPSAVDGWIPLAARARAAALYDPMSGARGFASVRAAGHGTELYVQIAPGSSRIVRTYVHTLPARAAAYPYRRAAGPSQPVGGTWNIRFVQGGPVLPPAATVEALGLWTDLPGTDVKRFAGTAAYTVSFGTPDTQRPAAWRLDLGRVCESADVQLNGRPLGTLIGPRFRVDVPASLLRPKGENRLQVLVTNLMANRIADLDRRHVPWKAFYNVGFAAKLAADRDAHGQFDASHWAPLCSGLVGPVTLTPLSPVVP